MSFAIDPSAYVLGLLDATDAERAAGLERTDPAFATEVRMLRAVTTRLDVLGTDEWTPEQPPPMAVPVRAEGTRQPAALRPWQRLTLPSLRLSPALAGGLATVLVAVGIGAGALIGSDSTSTPQPGSGPVITGQQIALRQFGTAPAGAGARAVVFTRNGRGRVRLNVHGLPANHGHSYYEVWMIRDAKHLTSLGTFTVGADGRGSVTLPVSVDPADYPVMDVSLEPDDGNPGHSHVSVLRSGPRSA